MNLFMIAKSNIKKNKNITITLIVLIIFASILLYIGTSVILEMNTFIYEKNKDLNGSDFTTFAPVSYQKTVEDILDQMGGYVKREEERAISASATFQNNTIKEKSQTMGCVILNADNNAKISKLKIIDQGDKKYSNSIIVPYFLKVSRGYRTGDKISVTYGGKAHNFVIFGFSEDIMFAIPSDFSYYKCYVYREEFKRLYKESAYTQSFFTKELLKEKNSTDYGNDFTKKINNKINDVSNTVNAINYNSMAPSVSIFFNILMMILIIFSIIIILIALTIIRFSVITYIEGSIKNIGSMEALGYTGGELLSVTILQFALITLVSDIVGLMISFSCTGIVKRLVSSSIGLVWEGKLNIAAVVINVCLIMASVIAMTYMAGSKIKKITPVIALRNGINTHSFKKNYLPLGKTKLNVNVAMGLKNLMNNRKQNRTILIIVTLMSFVCVFSFTVNYNFNVDNTAFLQLIGIEKPDLTVICTSNNPLKVFHEISKMDQVKETNRLSRNDTTLYMGDREAASTIFICNNFDQLKTNTIVKGRYPNHDNEIAITNIILKQLNAELGDAVTIKGTNHQEDYIIVGITQHITNLGRGTCITEEGMKRIYPEYKPTEFNVYLKNSHDITAVSKEIKKKYAGLPLEVIDMQRSFDSILDSFNNAINKLCLGCIFITLFIISLILYLLIKIRLMKERMHNGISKALGYTTKQIILQVLCGFSPICILGAFIGTVTATFLINPLMALLLSFAGILNCHFIISPMLALITFLSISLFSVLVTYIIAGSARKITPCELFGQ